MENEVRVELGEILHAIRKDKVMKIVLTTLCLSAWALDVLFPVIAHGSSHLGMFTNLLWIWEG